MYPFFLTMWRSPKQRAAIRSVIDSVSSSTNRGRLSVWADMVFSGFAFGSTAQEYENLRFYDRTRKNRATFITSYYNLRNYNRLNHRPDREIFRDKVRFNQTFDAFLKREWMLIDRDQPEAFRAFAHKHGTVIIKPRFGDSGKDIVFFDSREHSPQDIREYADRYAGRLAEELLTNHGALAALNPTSLNTVRIITIVTREDVEFLYAGIRIGAPDARIDNISMGGKVAAIDPETGRIVSDFRSKTTSEIAFHADSCAGRQIPCWTQVIDFVKRAATVVSGVRYVAWDVAITPDGPALIEGNHSSGNTITQAGIAVDSPGLRPKLEEILKKC